MTLRTETEIKAGIGKLLDEPFTWVLERVEAELRKEGFGILTRIDVKATMKEKLGKEMPPFMILGACNPTLAHKAISLEPEVGLMLPCNVVVRDIGGGKVSVEAVNALAMMSLFPEAELAPVAAEVNARLTRVIDAV